MSTFFSRQGNSILNNKLEFQAYNTEKYNKMKGATSGLVMQTPPAVIGQPDYQVQYSNALRNSVATTSQNRQSSL
jgi:hypothetical protein